jgi:hypothetical protein
MEPGRPMVAEDKATEDQDAEADSARPISRDELVALIEEALRSRGVLT